MNASATIQESETTRYLCAGVYLERAFRDTVLEQMQWESNRAVAVPHGVNVEPVLQHAKRAKRRATIRVLLLTIVVIAAFLYCTSVASTTTRDDEASVLPGLIGFWSIAAIVVFIGYFLEKRTLRMLGKGRPIVAPARDLVKIPVDKHNYDNHNVVVYSGFSPFVGSGIDLGGWSFVLRTDKAKEELGLRMQPIRFTNSELYDHVRSTLEDLGPEGLLIADKLYVNGQDIRDDNRFLPYQMGPPVSTVASEIVEQFKNDFSQIVRHYLTIHLIQWKGELVLSCFLRATQSGQHLFVEASYFLLPPVKESYYLVDSLPPHTSVKEVLELTVKSLLSAPFLCLAAPFTLWAEMCQPYHRWQKKKETENLIEENYSFDYGAMPSIRAVASSRNYRRYFQKLDKEMGLKLVERAILDSVVEFLDERNIDTSDLKDRTATILNNGVIVSGGYIQTDTFTGGQGASSNVLNRFAKKSNNLQKETKA